MLLYILLFKKSICNFDKSLQIYFLGELENPFQPYYEDEKYLNERPWTLSTKVITLRYKVITL